MTPKLVGYAHCSCDMQDVASQINILLNLDVAIQQIFTDRKILSQIRTQPGLDRALAALRMGDTLVISEPCRLTDSLYEARLIGNELIARQIKLRIAHQECDPVHLEAYLRACKAHDRSTAFLYAQPPNSSPNVITQATMKITCDHLTAKHDCKTQIRRMFISGDYSIEELCELFSVTRTQISTILVH